MTRVITSHRQTEGAGFVVRRPFPTVAVPHLDPFLLLDEMGPVDYAPGEAVGAPDHPHRGFETVTYVLEGETEHADSAGHRGTIGPGAVQWMTAGAGIVHSEMPSRTIQTEGGRVHGFQLWVNLPARLKMTTPRYQEIVAAHVPEATSHDGLAHVRVIAGHALGVDAAIDTHIPIVYQDWTLRPRGTTHLDLADDLAAMLYVFSGAVEVGADAHRVVDGQLAVLGAGDHVSVTSPNGARFLVLAGTPTGEPVARYGPFVMNTQAELQQAVDDFRSGRMGRITHTARRASTLTNASVAPVTTLADRSTEPPPPSRPS